MKAIEVKEGDLIAHFNGETEVIHRVTAVDQNAQAVSLIAVNTKGPEFTIPASLLAAALKTKACGLYTRDAISA